jgi:hypothetical protein
MKNAKVICVDFGSAYTKVAMRSTWDGRAKLTKEIPIAPPDATFCVPSVVARVERGGKTRWAIGQNAADLREGDAVRIYRNWNAELLTDDEPRREVKEAATAFFELLKDAMAKQGLPVLGKNCRTRVCIPKFEDAGRSKRRIIAFMSKAGWSLEEDRPTVYEPESNAIGVFSRGRNVTWYPAYPVLSKERHPHLRDMFSGSGMLGAIRRAIMEGTDDKHRVLVVDVGAFTTDFSYMEFDCDLDKKPEITQQSQRIGVGELDRLVRERLRPEVREAFEVSKSANWESIKQRLYRQEPQAILNADKKMLIIGEGLEAATIQEVVRSFADRIAAVECEFRRDFAKDRINGYVLTGGGAMIPLVREIVLKAAQDSGTGRIYDLLDKDEPRSIWSGLLLKKSADGQNRYDEREVELRLRENQELMRGGSAMGGCSVFFEAQ